eukprot:11917462-Prorocentrum_lima.AAC.1
MEAETAPTVAGPRRGPPWLHRLMLLGGKSREAIHARAPPIPIAFALTDGNGHIPATAPTSAP